MLLLFSSRTLLISKKGQKATSTQSNNLVQQPLNESHDDCQSLCAVRVTHLSLSALFFMLLSWLMALLFSMDILAWLARISLLCLKHDYSSSSVTWPSLELLTGLPPVKVYSSTVNGRVCEALTVLG